MDGSQEGAGGDDMEVEGGTHDDRMQDVDEDAQMDEEAGAE